QAESRGVELWDLTDEEYEAISEHLTPDVRTVLSTEGSLNSRNSQGGTAPAAVERQLAALEGELAGIREYAG
ncbi:MAG: argininosuccinate lyase, partial [Actinomycetota bacterium]|nr:argininosuccinate lyase [Actinomycetota bacterium]